MSKGDIEEQKIKEGIENCYSYDCGVKILEYAAVTAFINSLITVAKEQTARDIYEDIGNILKIQCALVKCHTCGDIAESLLENKINEYISKHIKGKGVE